jgi:chaperone BCS1
MEAIGSLLSPFGIGGSAVTDTLKLVVVGGGIETARRASMSVWNGFVDSFFLTAHFSDSDYPYDWLMHWLAKQPAWSRSREFEITSRRSNRRGISLSATNDIDDDEEDTGLNHGKGKRVVAFQPTIDTTHTIFYHGHWLRVTRSTGTWGDEALKISVVARNNDIFKRLVLEAKRDYEKEAENHVHIFMADS